MSGEVKRDPIEDRWKSTLWENNPELLEYTSSLERKLKIAEDKFVAIKDNIGSPSVIIYLANEALSAIREG